MTTVLVAALLAVLGVVGLLGVSAVALLLRYVKDVWRQ
jgi:hypothetical protein